MAAADAVAGTDRGRVSSDRGHCKRLMEYSRMYARRWYAAQQSRRWKTARVWHLTHSSYDVVLPTAVIIQTFIRPLFLHNRCDSSSRDCCHVTIPCSQNGRLPVNSGVFRNVARRGKRGYCEMGIPARSTEMDGLASDFVVRSWKATHYKMCKPFSSLCV